MRSKSSLRRVGFAFLVAGCGSLVIAAHPAAGRADEPRPDPAARPDCHGRSQAGCAIPACGLPGACGFEDADGDGLNDAWERHHYIDMNCNGKNDGPRVDVELPGADPKKKDLYVRYDYFETATHSHRPPAAALEQVRQAFARHGIRLHWLAPRHALAGPGGPGTEYRVVTLDGGASPGCAGTSFVTMPALRHDSLCNVDDGGLPCLPGDQQPAVHYLVFGHDSTTPSDAILAGACPNDSTCGGRPAIGASGSADVGGDDAIVSLGSYLDFHEPIGIELWSATILHELGHNLGLMHGGIGESNPQQSCLLDKPNYISVMNYSYQTNAIIPATVAGGTTPIDCDTDADCGPRKQKRGPCAEPNACHCTDDLGDYGGNLCYRIDYSDQVYEPLSESDLDEVTGVGGPADDRDIVLYWDSSGDEFVGPSNGSPIDWNDDGRIENPSSPAPDIDHNGTTNDRLETSTDWDKLEFAFQCQRGYGAGAPSAWQRSEGGRPVSPLERSRRLHRRRPVSSLGAPGCF